MTNLFIHYNRFDVYGNEVIYIYITNLINNYTKFRLNEIKENIVKPIIGKTYSLYGGEKSSDNFYDQLSTCADDILKLSGRSANDILVMISDLSRSKLRIKKSEKKDYFISSMMKTLRGDLSKYLVNVEEHLRSIKFTQLWDKGLTTSFEQYLLYLLEIELTNRIYLEQFSLSKKKLAFLPHCLRDFSKDCLAEPDDIDKLCKGCSKKCTINFVSKLLKKSEVTPYIWMDADLKKVFAYYQNQNNGIGVLGIACIPELTFGMRLCRKHKVPVIGIPLDANRCRRWMGDFYENSVNTIRLEKMLTNNV